MKDLVQFIAQKLVNNPEAVQVTEIEGATATLLELRVAKEDLGRVIGKHGRIADPDDHLWRGCACRTQGHALD
jgi:predicted RNA-binding protein YlqC (UPF0109 family)